MSQSENDSTNDDQEVEDHHEVERKKRTTPRQLWESRRHKDQTDETARRLNVQPVDNASEEEDEGPVEAGAETQPQEERDEQNGPVAAESTHASKEPPAGSSNESQGKDEGGTLEGVAQAEEDKGFERAEEFQMRAEEEVDAAESESPEDDAEMVDDEHQPGMMRNPYATYGPAPEDEDVPFGDKIIPSSFVLGVILIVASLLIGLALVVQHGRIVDLEDRVNALESALTQQQDTSDSAREE